ncbi:hypothetical protein R1A27_08585 [Methylobacterium sp. NMS12]|uniref:hypothetical protein n=1 Tax=Methylobacterium sp. NMS12 TaxID=3079766 RepID=UPI003F881534
MKQKALAQRGALRRASKSVGFAVDTAEANPGTAFRQDYLAARFGLTPSIASVVAELAFPAVDDWRRLG